MRFLNRIVLVICILMPLCSINSIRSFSINTGYEVKSISEEEAQKRKSSFQIFLKNTPAKGESILQFDVNDDGKIAIVTEEFGSLKKHINVFSSSGSFLYCLEFYENGPIWVEWDSELLNIMLGMIYVVNSSGNILEVFEVPYTDANNRYNYYLKRESKSVGDTTYRIVSFFNVPGGTKGKLIVTDPSGSTRVIYDSNPHRTIRIFILTTFILILTIFAVKRIIFQYKENKYQLDNYGKIIGSTSLKLWQKQRR